MGLDVRVLRSRIVDARRRYHFLSGARPSGPGRPLRTNKSHAATASLLCQQHIRVWLSHTPLRPNTKRCRFSSRRGQKARHGPPAQASAPIASRARDAVRPAASVRFLGRRGSRLEHAGCAFDHNRQRARCSGVQCRSSCGSRARRAYPCRDGKPHRALGLRLLRILCRRGHGRGQASAAGAPVARAPALVYAQPKRGLASGAIRGSRVRR